MDIVRSGTGVARRAINTVTQLDHGVQKCGNRLSLVRLLLFVFCLKLCPQQFVCYQNDIYTKMCRHTSMESTGNLIRPGSAFGSVYVVTLSLR